MTNTLNEYISSQMLPGSSFNGSYAILSDGIEFSKILTDYSSEDLETHLAKKLIYNVRSFSRYMARYQNVVNVPLIKIGHLLSTSIFSAKSGNYSTYITHNGLLVEYYTPSPNDGFHQPCITYYFGDSRIMVENGKTYFNNLSDLSIVNWSHNV